MLSREENADWRVAAEAAPIRRRIRHERARRTRPIRQRSPVAWMAERVRSVLALGPKQHSEDVRRAFVRRLEELGVEVERG